MITLVDSEPKFRKFLEWEASVKEYQLDVETDLNEFPDRRLLTIQFGDTSDQWVFHLPSTLSSWLGTVKQILNDVSKVKLIHNAAFEYRVFAKHGIFLENIYDTMLVEQVLDTGNDRPKGYYGLKSLVYRYFGIELSKDLQTSFTPEQLSWEQVEYAAYDVMYLQRIRDDQIWRLKNDNLEYIAALENEAVLAFGDISHNGLTLDTERWKENIDLAQPIIDDSEARLNGYLRVGGDLHETALSLGFIRDEDTLLINWNSPVQKREILSKLYPDLAGPTKPLVTAYLKTHESAELTAYLAKDYKPIEGLLVRTRMEFLRSHGFISLKGDILLNWDSPGPRLKLFKTIWPDMPAGDAAQVELLAEKHPIGYDYREYVQSKKLVTSFGEEFIAKNVRSDGKVHTDFRQILDTGRVSSSGPNMQQIPAKESVGTRYRNAFTCEAGWAFIDSDYSSQELVIIAHISRDPVWKEALENGQDLHSVCAQLVYGNKWTEAADDGCAFMANKEKCKCKKHKSMRTTVKTINFGLAYGMGENKLASTLKISIEEAAGLIASYFAAFPGIGKSLDASAAFGIENGYITTPAPFYRRRYFSLHPYYQWDIPFWKQGKYVDYLGTIDRASRNMPIQGGAADMIKVALVFIRNYINENGYRNDIKIVMQVHDQITTICKEELASWWLTKLTELMEDAAKVIVPTGLLKAETTNTGTCWSK